MSISPPPFSPPRSELSDDDNNNRYLNNDDDDDDDDEYINSPRTLISSFDLYKNAIDRLRSSITSQTIDEQKSSLDEFKPLTTRSNAWLYMRIHDDLFKILLEYLVIDNLTIQSTVLSIFANIACERDSHEQIFETNLIDIVCRKVLDVDQIDITNRCFRLLGNVCSFEDAARKMIDADLTRSMGNVLRTCTDAACLHSIIRCSRKLSTYSFCRDRMLDSMCLLSICKQLFSEKVALRKEAMKAVLEWDIGHSDRSRSQLREGEIFRFLISTIETQSDKEYRHLAFRLLNNLLRHSDMRTEFGLRNGLDFLFKMITTHQYQSTYEHLKFFGLFCVCCQETINRRLIKDDHEKLRLFFHYLDKYQYRSNFLDLLLTAIGQFIYDETSLTIFVKQMQFIERMSDLLETVVLVKYENYNEINIQKRKKFKTIHHTTTNQVRQSVTIEFNEVLFTEFVENTYLDDERQTTNSNENLSKTLNIEIRRRTEGLIFTLLSKLSYETTDKTLRRYLYNPRLISLLLRYIYFCDEPNPRAIRILSRLTKMIDCYEYLIDLGLPYLMQTNFYPNENFLDNFQLNINTDDQYLLNILLNDNRAFFQRLSWTNERNRLKTIEYSLRKNLENFVNTPYGINEIIRKLNETNNEEKFQTMLMVVSIIKEQHFQSILFDQCSGYKYLIEQSTETACLWAFRTLANRCLISNNNENYLQEYMNQLEKYSSNTSIISNRTIQLNLNNQQILIVNPDLLSHHSEYFKTLFHGPYIERNQSIICLHLPESISIESFIYLNHLLIHTNESIEMKHTDNLIHLCDKYLFDYLPYQLVGKLFKQFQNGIFETIEDFHSKSNLIITFIRACFIYLLTNEMKNSNELFLKLITNYSDQFEKLIQSILKHQCWFDQEDSPFLL